MQPQDRQIEGRQVGAVMASLRRAMSARLDSGLLPYEGRWVPLSDVEEGVARERRQAWIHAFELLLLYGAGFFTSVVILALMWMLVY